MRLFLGGGSRREQGLGLSPGTLIAEGFYRPFG